MLERAPTDAAREGRSASRFTPALLRELMSSMLNWYGPENWDAEFLGPYPESLRRSLLTRLNALLRGSVVVLPLGSSRGLLSGLSSLDGLLEGLDSVHARLADEASRQMLVKVVAYRLLGHTKVKLPTNTPGYWAERARIKRLASANPAARLPSTHGDLVRVELSEIGYPIELYSLPSVETFVLQQYAYRKRRPEIRARAGAYVVDGGAGWGDTTLYFAHGAGGEGRVFAFEFVPENLAVLRRNLELNPGLASRVEVVEQALWDTSGEKVVYDGRGPETSIVFGERPTTSAHEVETVTLDDFVASRTLPRVDYVKLDVEGAELAVLRGAEETLRTFKPDLAVAVYHRERDVIDICDYLDDCGVGYEFYLDHFTIYGAETVLFATAREP